MVSEIDAVSAVVLRPDFTLADIWRDDVIHVDGVHSEAFGEVGRAFTVLRAGQNPANIVLQGRPGIGKSHFLGRLRKDVLAQDGLFVLVELADARQFWQSVSISLVDSLFRDRPAGGTQLAVLIDKLGSVLGLAQEQGARLASGEFSVSDLGALVVAARRRLGRGSQSRYALDTLIGLTLLNSCDFVQNNVGSSIHQGVELSPKERRQYSLSDKQIAPRDFVKGFDALLSIAGHYALFAIDQLDGLIALGNSVTKEEETTILNQVANGLMDLANDTRRGLVVVSCLPVSWVRIAHDAIAAAADRFPTDLQLRPLPSAEVARNVADAYLSPAYQRVGFTPPHRTWPIAAVAFDAAVKLSPRELLKSIEQHIRRCRTAGCVTELDALTLSLDGKGTTAPAPVNGSVPAESLADLNQRFQKACESVDVGSVTAEGKIDGALPELIQAGLLCWAEENFEQGSFQVDPLPGRKPSLHGKLRQVLDPSTEDEVHWSFRAIPHENARAALTRLREAMVAAGLGAKRKLFILRNSDWSRGKETQKVLAEFSKKGGEVVQLEDSDVRVFHGLARLRREAPAALSEWLRVRRPASATEMLRRLHISAAHPPTSVIVDDTLEVATPEDTRAPDEPSIVLGYSATSGAPVYVRLKALCRHTAIFAGSGSGKTVLIRRIVEECALAGISSIVLDPNNDLARLGSPWPEAPKGWRADDVAKAQDYHANTDVVIWTPRLNSGRPLAFAPLADLNALINDADEFDISLDNAVAQLADRAGLPNGAKRDLGRAVLSEALRAFFTNGGGGLREFVRYLQNLPPGVSVIDEAAELGRKMAQALRAASINDPMFGGQGAPIDPGMLLQPAPGKRARISVINFVGLPNDDQRQSFVAQLQMALFAWVKKNPAGDRPLGGLLVMDEAQIFAPSSGGSLCLHTTLALAAQARKYGLGLVFATQAPKGLNNRIPGNATTQFFGFMNVPVQIQAAKEMAAARGGDVSGIAQLHSGDFFVASEGVAFQKIKSPLCLSWHPRAPLTQEEVAALAREG
jgi:uncharacterized protein DUF87